MSNAKTALITGASGQDGSYLSELLVSKGYRVHGLKRRASSFNTQRIDHLFEMGNLDLHYGDVTDGGGLTRLLAKIRPDEIYNLAAQSHVAVSFELPEYTAEATALGALRILEAMRSIGIDQSTRFYQAGSSEMFGHEAAPQSECTPFSPVSPYGVAKVFAHQTVITYRNAYGMHASNGILFNHESPRRGETFVSRKIARGVAAIARGSREPIRLGNLDALRDWGHARDYVRAMWMILQQPHPNDLVIATGETHSVRDFAALAFRCVGIDLEWATDDLGINRRTGRHIVEVDPRLFRPIDIPVLCGDASLAVEVLGWHPEIDFEELVEEMVRSELDLCHSTFADAAS